MPSTPILGITQVSTSQNGKETTINDAILALEEATNAKLVVSLAAGNATLTATEATRNFIFEAAEATADRELLFPTTVNGNPYNRAIVVRNKSGYGLTVRFTTSGLTTANIPNGESRLISADAATGMDVAAEPPSVISFLSLTDAPDTFTGAAGKFLTVNAEGTALEFITGSQFPPLTGNANRFLMVNASGTGVQWAVPNIVTDFASLTDTPNSYAGQAGKLVRVNSASSGLEFITPEETEAVSFINAARWRILALEPGQWPENPPELDPSDPEYITPTDQVGFGEIEFLDLDGLRINIAGTASASNAQTGFEADRAFNQITTIGDGWRTEASYTGPVWIEFEFSTQISPRRVRLTPINGAPQYTPMRFLIQYWDGAAWISLGDRTPAPWESEVPQTFRINGVPLSTLSEAPQNSSLYGRFNGQWLKINAEAVTDSTATYNLDATHVFQYRRFTNAGAKTLNIRTNAAHGMPDDGEWFIYNASGGVLTIVPASGVTVNAPAGGSLIVPLRGTVRIKRVAVNVYDLFGDTLSTESGGEVPPLIGNANRVLSVNADATGMVWITPPVTYTDEQARDAIGAALVAGTNVEINVNDAANTITIAASGIGLDAEGVRDTIGNALRAGTNIEVNINDALDTITIATTALDAEGVRDTIGAALVAGSNIAINVNDAANTITVAATMDQEVIRDTIATALVAGDNISIIHDDAANTITISAFGGGGGGGLSAEDVRDVVGATLVAGTNVSINVNDALDTITINATTDPEVVRDTIGSALVAGSNVSINVNDAADTITVSATMDQEVIRDTIATSLVAGTNISIVHDDPGNTITISAVGSAAGLDAEEVRDLVGATLVAGTNVTINVNDLSDTITISAAGTDPEVVRDTIGAALVAGSNVTINVNDAANTITISAAGTDPEVVRDTMGTALTAGAGISIVNNDAADTITISNTFDAEFIRDTIGTTLVAGENVEILVDDDANTITINAATDPEVVRDTMGTALVAGTNVTINVDDPANTITISAAGTDPEVVRDTIAAALVGGSGINILHDDTANTITITATGGGEGGSTDPEIVRDTIAAALVAGTGISIDVNDAADTITINATGGGSGGGTDPEGVRDTIAAALVGGSGINIVADDAADTITISIDEESISGTTSGILARDIQRRPPRLSSFPTTVNSPVVSETNESLMINGAAGNAIRAILKPVQSANFTVTTRLRGHGRQNFDGAGIVVRDTAGKYIQVGPVTVSGGAFVEAGGWGNSTTFSAGNSGGGGVSFASCSPVPEWFRAQVNVSTNAITWSYSFDGSSWIVGGTTTYLTTIDAYGIAVTNRGSASTSSTFLFYEDGTADDGIEVSAFVGGNGTMAGELAFMPPTLSQLPTTVLLGASQVVEFNPSKGLSLSVEANGSGRAAARVQNAPALPFTIATRIVNWGDSLSGVDRGAGIVLRNSSNGRSMVIGQTQNSNGGVFHHNFSNISTFASQIGQGNTNASVAVFVAVHVDVTGLATSYWSHDGVSWAVIGSQNISAYLTASGGSLDQVGIFTFGDAISGRRAYSLCTYYRVNTANPPLPAVEGTSTPLGPPALPIFPAAPRLANFTQRNISAPATATNIDRGILISSPATIDNNLRMLTVPAIAAPWTLTCKLKGSFMRRNFVAMGAVLANPGSNQWRTIRNFFQDNAYGSQYGFGTHNSLTDIANSQTVGVQSSVPENDFWMRVTDDGTTRIVFISADGVAWQEVVREATSAFSATDVGIVFSNRVTNSPTNVGASTLGHAVLEYFEYCPTNLVTPITSTTLLQALPVTSDPSSDTTEVIRDTVANALRGGSGIVISHDDPSDTITISTTGLLNGGVQTPTIRAAGATQYFSGPSVVVPFPAGTVTGDTVFLFTHHGFAANNPSGWVVLNNAAGTNTNGATFMKVMSPADIAAGSVTLTYSGSFAGVAQPITIVGPVAPRSVTVDRQSTGTSSTAFNANPTQTGDLLLGFFGNRANSINFLPSGWTGRGGNANADASSVFGTLTAEGASYTGTATASTAGTGRYVSVVSIIAANGGSGITQFLPILTVPDTSYNLPAAAAGRYVRFTGTSAKTVNIRSDSVHPMAQDSEWHLRNSEAGNLTLVPAGGVTINAPAGGTLVIPPNGVVTLKRVDLNVYDLTGTTIAVPDDEPVVTIPDVPYVVTSGAVARPLGGETLLIHIFSEAIEFAANFAGSRGFAGTLPTTNTSFSIRRNGTPVGGILITTAGVVTFTSLDEEAVSFVAGDVMTIVAQDPADLTIANVAFNLRGGRT